MLLELRASGKDRQPLLEVLASMLPSTREADGCLSIAAHEVYDPDDGTIVLVEEWESAEHYDHYTAWRRERGDLQTLIATTDGRPTSRYLRGLEI